ncbi:LPS-assembly lipoprotein LptE [Inhella gelatinilytica]|uniref:LPS-assembly lipoprotein LptE n=1 Tax=Inhella gelatinilytica TaxID=2795030 RepID=A0A931ND00_9BURK|nr:LPS assembly lipoprotein LptE [Inhella gelatinilytica]MBH9551735.1 hypothetical protein [Inhella gelatinilytica]
MAVHRRTALGLLPAALLAGCGFQLRQAPQLPMERLHLSGFGERSPLRLALERQLARTPVQVVPQRSQAQVVLEVLRESHHRVAVASTAAGQVRAWQLHLVLSYRLTTPQDEVLLPTSELHLTRDLSTTESLALAKEAEEADLRRAMHAEAVSLLLRRLAAIRLK